MPAESGIAQERGLQAQQHRSHLVARPLVGKGEFLAMGARSLVQERRASNSGTAGTPKLLIWSFTASPSNTHA